MFGSGSPMPQIVGGGGGLVCEPVGKTDQLSDYVNSLSITTFAFKSCEVGHLLLNVHP